MNQRLTYPHIYGTGGGWGNRDAGGAPFHTGDLQPTLIIVQKKNQKI